MSSAADRRDTMASSINGWSSATRIRIGGSVGGVTYVSGRAAAIRRLVIGRNSDGGRRVARRGFEARHEVPQCVECPLEARLRAGCRGLQLARVAGAVGGVQFPERRDDALNDFIVQDAGDLPTFLFSPHPSPHLRQTTH